MTLITGENKPSHENNELAIIYSRTNHQNSLRRARPLKTKHFLKHVTTDSMGDIIGLAITRG